MALTEAQKRWQRNYYRKVRKYKKSWLANCEKKKRERKAKADPNIEREYFQERYFRFRGRFARQDLWDGLSVTCVESLRNTKFVFEYKGHTCYEDLSSRLPSW